jgi:hypothetical protein
MIRRRIDRGGAATNGRDHGLGAERITGAVIDNASPVAGSAV